MQAAFPINANNWLLSGGEACARGAYEAGVRLAIGYPGTPATSALEYLIGLKGSDLRAEWAVNEKVALEVAVGHSWAGQRSFVAVKMSGLNVACDTLLSLATSGTKGGLVILVGDDPGAYYGMVEQDSRLIAKLAMLPMIESSTPEEARLMCRDAFDVSERTEAPVLFRQTTTTAIAAARVEVENPLRAKTKTMLPCDPARYTKAGARACRVQHAQALERLKNAGREFDYLNEFREGYGRFGIISSASTWSYVRECLGDRKGFTPHLLKVAVINPLPEEKISLLLQRCDRVLVVEELTGLIEEKVQALAWRLGKRIEIIGKSVLPEVGDLDPDLVDSAISVLVGEAPGEIPPAPDVSSYAPRRSNFCPGCPHRSTYAALDLGIRGAGLNPEEVLVTGDIGCTILGMEEPFNLCRTELVMGASISMAQGFAYAGVDTPVIAAIGDSTFYHSGFTSLVNASSRDINLTVIVLDNESAAMTGFQPTVATTYGASDIAPVRMNLLEMAKAAKVKKVTAATPYFTRRMAKAITAAISSKGVNVIISQAPCAANRKFRAVIPCKVQDEKCKGTAVCKFNCLSKTGCSAIAEDVDTGKAAINRHRCIGCGLCVEYCPFRAISRSIGLLRRF